MDKYVTAPDNFYYKCDRCNKEVQRAYILRTNFPSALPAIPVYHNTYICEECMEDAWKGKLEWKA